VKTYQAFGEKGLITSRENREHSFEFKLHVVESYLTTDISYQDLALSVGLTNSRAIKEWVAVFREAGPEALRQRQEGRPNEVARKRKAIPTEQDKKSEYVKQLEHELLYAKIENAYLKGLRRLRLKEAKWKKRARVVHSLRGSYRLKDILAVAKLPKATYMYWQKRMNKPNPDLELEEEIKEIRLRHKDFGYRRIYGELKKLGILINKKKVQRIVQKLGLQVTSFTRRSRKYSSYRGTVGTVAFNRLRRRFNTSIPYQKITTDTTEFKYYEIDNKGHMAIRKLYLDPFMDLYNREIISFNIAKQPNAQGIMAALNAAIEVTSDCRYRRTFHSDQGWAYQMKSYVDALNSHRIFQSMSRKGNCHDNSVMENFFGIMKQEMYYGCAYYSYDSLKTAIEKYIKYYNEQRIKKSLGWMSPIEYRLSLQVS